MREHRFAFRRAFSAIYLFLTALHIIDTRGMKLIHYTRTHTHTHTDKQVNTMRKKICRIYHPKIFTQRYSKAFTYVWCEHEKCHAIILSFYLLFVCQLRAFGDVFSALVSLYSAAYCLHIQWENVSGVKCLKYFIPYYCHQNSCCSVAHNHSRQIQIYFFRNNKVAVI